MPKISALPASSVPVSASLAAVVVDGVTSKVPLSAMPVSTPQATANSAVLASAAADATAKVTAHNAAEDPHPGKFAAYDLSDIDVELLGDIDFRSAAQEGRCILPRVGTWYAFGTSQTMGGTSAIDPTVEDGALKPEYRYPNRLATSKGRALTVENNAIGGSRISWIPANAANSQTKSHFNMMGLLPNDWTGVASLMAPYNNVGGSSLPDAQAPIIQNSDEACIARALITDWIGLGLTGWTRAQGLAGAGGSGFTTTGTDASLALTGGIALGVNPFPYRNAANTGIETNGFRPLRNLAAGEYDEWTITGKRMLAVFFEYYGSTPPKVNDFLIKINGGEVWRGNSLYVPLGGYDQGQYPGVVVVDNLPATAVLRVQSIGGDTKILAIGTMAWGDTDGRTIIIGNEGNAYPDKSPALLQRVSRRIQDAVAAFENFPVYFADVLAHVDQTNDVFPDDQYHYNAYGHAHMARAFSQPFKPNGRSRNVITLPDATTLTNTTTAWTGSDSGLSISAGGLLGVTAIGSVTTGQSLVEVRGRDVNLSEGYLNLIAHSGNASSRAGSTYFQRFNGSTFTKSGRINKDGRWLFKNTSAFEILPDSSGAMVQLQDSVSVGGGTAISRIKHGTAVLVAGTVTVADTTITANSRILPARFTDGGTVGSSYSVTRSAGVGFTITSKEAGATQTLDTSTIAYQIIEP